MVSISPSQSPGLEPLPFNRTGEGHAIDVPSTSVASGATASDEPKFTFSDFLSVINPLQHIPIVGTIYRAITGDTINPTSRVLGGALFGGPIGLVASVFNAIMEQATGKDLGDTALALLKPGADTVPPVDPPAAQYAAATSDGTKSAPIPAVAPGSADVAPLSRALFSAATAPSGATALGVTPANGDRSLGGSLVPRSRAGTAGASESGVQGRSLSDYRNFSGRPLPVVDAARSGSTSSAPVRLQTTGPMVPERTARTPVAAPVAETAGDRTPRAVAKEAASSDGPSAAGPSSHWFSAAMMRGLDRYREGKRLDAPPPQIDTTL